MASQTLHTLVISPCYIPCKICFFLMWIYMWQLFLCSYISNYFQQFLFMDDISFLLLLFWLQNIPSLLYVQVSEFFKNFQSCEDFVQWKLHFELIFFFKDMLKFIRDQGIPRLVNIFWDINWKLYFPYNCVKLFHIWFLEGWLFI